MGLNNLLKLIWKFLLFLTGITLIARFYRNNTLLTLLMIIAAIICLILWHTKKDIIFFLNAAILGPIAEISCIYFGAWNYTNPSFLNIPIWLPLAWGFAVLIIKKVGEDIISLLILE